MTYWAIYTTSTGALLDVACADSHPRFHGYAWDGSTMSATNLGDTAPDMAVMAWSPTAKGFTEDPAKVEASLVAAVKAEAERRKMMVRSTGCGKSTEYRQKRAEAVASNNILAAVLNALTQQAGMAQYPCARREANLTGEPLATVLARYLAAMTFSDNEVFRVAAIEQAGVRSIKAATDAAAKRAAFAAINWNWSD